MQAYTEEQRKALIERARETERLLSRWCDSDAGVGETNGALDLSIIRIALASLAAEPVEYRYRERNPCTNCVTGWESVDKELYLELLKVTDPDTAEFELRYITPPAPAIRLPPEVDNWDNSASRIMKNIGYVGSKEAFTIGANWMRGEAERLNATAPQPIKLPEYDEPKPGVVGRTWDDGYNHGVSDTVKNICAAGYEVAEEE